MVGCLQAAKLAKHLSNTGFRRIGYPARPHKAGRWRFRVLGCRKSFQTRRVRHGLWHGAVLERPLCSGRLSARSRYGRLQGPCRALEAGHLAHPRPSAEVWCGYGKCCGWSARAQGVGLAVAERRGDVRASTTRWRMRCFQSGSSGRGFGVARARLAPGMRWTLFGAGSGRVFRRCGRLSGSCFELPASMAYSWLNVGA